MGTDILEKKQAKEDFEKGKSDAINSYKKDGRYLVIAGPGTGKTFTLTKRIEAILKDEELGSTADRILCLTFSDAAANEMRKKLEKNNVPDANLVNIFTFHGFCLSIMEENPELFEMENRQLITVVQKQAFVKECIDDLGEELKYLNTYNQIDDIVERIEAIKHNRLTPEKIKENIKNNIAWEPLLKEFKAESEEKQEHMQKLEEVDDLLKIFDLYKKKTKEFIDFDDMINSVLDKFDTDARFLQKIAEQYDFVHVDEYQDTNKSQNEIVFQLAKHCKNILVVGDDDQIIYAFQGASLDTIKNFHNEFKDNVEIFNLNWNFRSTENILKTAEILAKYQDEYPLFYSEFYYKGTREKPVTKADKEAMAVRPFPMRFQSKNLEAKNADIFDKKQPVRIREYNDEPSEAENVVNKIEEIINDETRCPNKDGEKCLSEIAILTRSNSDAVKYAAKLKERGIRVQLSGGKNIFEINSVKVLVAYMQFLSNPEQNPDKLYRYLLSKPFHIKSKDYAILHSEVVKSAGGSSLIRRMEKAIELSEKEEAKEKDKNYRYILSEKEKLRDFIDTYNLLNAFMTTETIKNTIIQIIHKTGIAKCYLSLEINRAENADAINCFLNEVDIYTQSDKQATFRDFMNYINTLIDGGIELKTDKTEKPYNAVQVSTLHGSKGREYEYVFMPSLQSSKFEKNAKENNEELVPMEVKEIETPNKDLSLAEKLEDKRRQIRFLNSAKLLYVGMTRAKYYLELSFVKRPRIAPSWFIDKLMEYIKLNKIQNLTEYKQIGGGYFANDKSYKNELAGVIRRIENIKENTSNCDDDFDSVLETLKHLEDGLLSIAMPDEASVYDYDYKTEFDDYITDNIPKVHSVSSLNEYVDCPRKYFYNRILHLAPAKEVDDYDKIEKDEKYAEWGTIIHAALENYVRDVIKDKKHFGFELMEKYFDESLKENIDNPQESVIKTKKEHLETCYKELIKIPPEQFYKVEFDVSGDDNECVDIEGLKFTGKIDRIDIIESDIKGDGPVYNIIDYKTGTGKEKIKGETAIGRKKESIYNQLAFYKYVLENKYDKKVNSVGIVFPEEISSSFDVEELKGESGKSNCEKVIKEFVNIVNIEITEKHNFECKEGCKADNYCFCNYKDFCKSRII